MHRSDDFYLFLAIFMLGFRSRPVCAVCSENKKKIRKCASLVRLRIQLCEHGIHGHNEAGDE